MGLVRFLILASFFGLAFFNAAYADRIKDMADVAGVRSNQLVGYGLVVGLAGTGDGNSGLTLQSMQAMVSRFGLVTDAAGLTATNVAAVMVTADLKPFVKPGQTLDITVSTLGASKSLRGGTLLMTPLLGADGETYAIAQGNLVVGGLGWLALMDHNWLSIYQLLAVFHEEHLWSVWFQLHSSKART